MLLSLLIAFLFIPGVAQADPGNQYCVTPPFITAGIQPNLLLMMDNSASMFDLAYADKGTATRTPIYCNDNTFSDANSYKYAGYFDPDLFYDFDIDAGTFTEIGTFPAAGSCTYRIDGKYCIALDAATPRRVTKFSASGNYLNWLSASKFDIQKKILTGGKYDGTNLNAESRGCVGRGFIKQPLSSNSGNYVEGGTNTAIGISLQIKGALDSYDETAMSTGGQTFIYFYSGSGGTGFNSAICKTALGHLTDGTSMSGPDKDDVLSCIGAAGGTTDLSGKKKQIFNQSLQECWQYNKNSPPSIQGNDYLNVTKFCTDVFNGRDADHGPLAFNPASDVKVGDADLLCSDNYVGTCYSGTRNVAALSPTPSSIFDFLLPKSAYAAGEGSLQFKAATYSVSEGTATVSVCATRTGGKSGKVDVTYTTSNGTAVAGSDYTATTGTLSWNNNNADDKCFTVNITNDAVAEASETFKITLSAPLGGALLGAVKETIVTILDNDGTPPAGTIALGAATYSVNEGGIVTITAGRTGGSAGTLKVSYATSNGTASSPTHYTATSGTIEWLNGDVANKTFTVPTFNTVPAGSLTFTVTLAPFSGTTLGTPASAVVSINNDSANGNISIASPTYTINQTATPLTVTLTRVGTAGAFGAATVNYTTSDGTAVAGTNYTAASGTISWAASDAASKTFTIPIINAGGATDTTFTVSISSAVGAVLGGTTSATVTITGTAPSPGTWTDSWNGCVGGSCGDACIKLKHEEYCAGFNTPSVTDPTDAPGDTSVYGNIPAVLGDMAIEGQLGAPLKILSSGGVILDAIPVRLSATNPEGLIQTFASKIRVGLMSFNYTGSASECASGSSIACPKVCKDTETGLIYTPTKTCASFLDCCQNSYECSCDATVANGTNADGAKLLYPVGFGVCSHDNTVTCTTNENCNSLSVGSKCVTTGGGSHGSGLVNQIDALKATSWTPFSEAFYNAIGYFGYTAPTVSRTALRINDGTNTGQPIDFPADKNPSQFPCQQNYILLISDGVSTADQRTEVMNLANTYKTAAGLNGGACTSYKGSSNLPILSWLANQRNISNFNTGSASTALPALMRDKITSYVVFNGQDNGVSGECNSVTLMSNTATKGGGLFYLSPDPVALENNLRSVFEQIAAKAASGTAASILSNSEGSGANILQAVFYPRKIFAKATEVAWVGEMQNLWYFVDPYINNSTIREDSNRDLKLHLVNDYVARFAFDTTADKTMVQLYEDTDGNGTGDAAVGGLIDPDNVKSLWRAGRLLWERNINTSPRNLLTSINADKPTAPPSLIHFSSGTYPGGTVSSNATTLAPYLNVAVADAPNLINWVHGLDTAPYRSRRVEIETAPNVFTAGNWLLGDIISSTPRVQSTIRLNTYNLPYPGGYNDFSYQSFVNSNDYQTHGMVYVGGNDGMFHAFNLGILSVKSSGFQKASLSGANLGKEMWAYIPKHTLPYLKYLADPGYSHIYSIDGRTAIFDASIGYTGDGTCVRATYDTCDKPKNSVVVDSSNNLDSAKNTWRSIVIGGMGIGGASTKSCTAGSDCVQTPLTDPGDTTNNPGLGYSTYFALDVTNPTSPQLLWEYANSELGYSTTGPAIIRIGPQNKNGKWYAVFGSGPTGPIDTTTHQFLGRSNQNLKFFVVDMQTGIEAGVIDTGIANAFAGSMIGSAIDVDRGSPSYAGNYQDDALYVGYTKVDTSVTPNEWIQGGVGRIITKESATVSDWVWAPLLDDIGPVTTAVSRLQDKKNRNFWLFFGTGRYFYRDPASVDDNNSTRALYGIKEPCYNTADVPGNFLDRNCTAALSGPVVDQTSSLATLVDTDSGWKITLDAAGTIGAERVVTDTVALTNGTVFFTSFKPSIDLCSYGGSSYLWGVKYNTGGQAAANALIGKALIQLSTGEFREVDLSAAFTTKLNRRMDTPMTGKPPSDAPPIISNSQNRPLKKILHIQER